MSAAWLFYVLLVGSLLAVSANALDDLARRLGVASRWIWIAAMSGTLAFAIVAPEHTTRELPYVQHVAMRATGIVATPTPSATLSGRLYGLGKSVDALFSGALAAADRTMPRTIYAYFLTLWVLSSATLLSIIIIVNRRADRAKREWARRRVLGTPVLIAPDTGPAVIGLARPDIVLPDWILSRDAEEQRIILAHECEHVRTRDQLLPVAGWILTAILPWHPAVWWMLSRLRLSIELDCDARVLRNTGIDPRPYGTLLIDIAERCAPFRMNAVALADGSSHLERRLVAMKNRSMRITPLRAGVLGGVSLLAIAVACESRMPTSAEIATMDVASAERLATKARLMETNALAPTVYDVDGEPATEARVRALPSDSIGSIEVDRKPSVRVAITTKARMVATGHLVSDTATLRGVVDGQQISAEETQRMIAKPQTGVTLSKRKTLSDPASQEQAETMLRTPKGSGASPVYVIDGKVITESAFAKLSLSENDIASVEVIKGAGAASIYGEALEKLPGAPSGAHASDGVIVIKTIRGGKR